VPESLDHSPVAGKFPTPISHAEDLSNKLTEVLSTIEFQLKKVLCLGVAIGHVQMTDDQVLGNDSFNS
jgi:large subunit ribosomal protein L10Ae